MNHLKAIVVLNLIFKKQMSFLFFLPGWGQSFLQGQFGVSPSAHAQSQKLCKKWRKKLKTSIN